LIQHTNGTLYGDTVTGGFGGYGTFFSINVALPPHAFVSLLPYSGKVGNTIEFLGQGFTSTSAVSFNGTAATRTVVSGTYLTATVPNGVTTGFVTVTTSGAR
jgi:IPT/TIG domain